MRLGAIPLLLAVPLWMTNALAETRMIVQVRGQSFSLAHLEASTKRPDVAVVFLPGDGGWRGAAVAMSRAISSWGYEVFGFDTKRYLETFSEGGRKLAPRELAADVRLVADQIAGPSHRRVVLVGWSQGASMSVAAVSGIKSRSPIHGVITLGLPESGVLGWDWKATLAVIARREPDQPTFEVKPLLPMASPVPIWMIHGTDDEYTTSAAARSLFEVTSEPKRLEEITGANHRFDGHQDELYRSLEKGLAWVFAN